MTLGYYCKLIAYIYQTPFVTGGFTQLRLKHDLNVLNLEKENVLQYSFTHYLVRERKLFEVIMKADRPDSVVKPAALDQRKNVEIQI